MTKEEVLAYIAARDPRYIPHRDGARPVSASAKVQPGTTGAEYSHMPGGVGTELKRLLRELGFPSDGCGPCSKLANYLDSIGVERCAQDDVRAEMIGRLREQQREANLAAYLRAGARAIASGLAFKLDPFDPAPGLYDEALRRARTPAAQLSAGGPEESRHLLYYVWPRRGNGVWQLNLDQLLARIRLFGGRKVVAVATSADADDPGAVRDYLAGSGCEVFTITNDPALREVAAWDALWERVMGRTGPGDATFFGHAKGVTKPVNPGVTVHEWASVMYECNLDYWPIVASQLQVHPIVGTFKKVGQGFQRSGSAWHYSGTFYWVRNADFFSRDWRGGIDRTWWGTEAYPGRAYAQEEGGITFGRGIVPKLDLYTRATWDRIRPSLETWRRANAGNRTTFPSVTGSANEPGRASSARS